MWVRPNRKGLLPELRKGLREAQFCETVMTIFSQTEAPVTARQLFQSCLLDPARQDERERRFFSSLKLSNGTYKTTQSRRLDDLNELILRLRPRATSLEVMDVAVSSGISTIEWLESLEHAGIRCEMMAGDYSLTAFLLSVGDRLAVLVDKHGYTLQFDVFGRALPNPLGGRNIIRYWAPLLLLKTVVWLCSDGAQTAIQRHRLAYWDRFRIRCSPITLVSPRLKSRPNLRLIEDDILLNDRIEKRFHIVRAANILNKAYFDDAILQKMLLNLRARLLPEGLLAVCRTETGGGNQATVFVLHGGRLTVVGRLGAGSEIEEIALGLPGSSIGGT
jgi:hypothetical protein